jgi:hypothetical protein
MWDPRRLTTLWASTVCYRDIFTISYKSLFLNQLIAAISIIFFLHLCRPIVIYKQWTWALLFQPENIRFLSRTARVITLCTPLPLHHCFVRFETTISDWVKIKAKIDTCFLAWFLGGEMRVREGCGMTTFIRKFELTVKLIFINKILISANHIGSTV